MWNVYQYIKDYGDNKISDEEFLRIYKSQEVLRTYISDCYNDVKNHDLIALYKENSGIIFPYSSFKNLNDFILNGNDFPLLKNICKALTICVDKIYKSNY